MYDYYCIAQKFDFDEFIMGFIGETLRDKVCKENFDKLLAICQVCQNFPPSNFCCTIQNLDSTPALIKILYIIYYLVSYMVMLHRNTVQYVAIYHTLPVILTTYTEVFHDKF